MLEYSKLYSKQHEDVFIKIIPGHFVTPNAHISHYVDMTTMKSRVSEAHGTAIALAEDYAPGTVVDTIICMDGTEVIGAYLAEELLARGIITDNLHKTIYVMTPEYDTYGQMIFRDNVRIMIEGKHVLLLLASATTGKTMGSAIEAIKFFGGVLSGVSAIFSGTEEVGGIPVYRLFSIDDLGGYEHYSADKCRMCEAGQGIDAICNGFGYTVVNQ